MATDTLNQVGKGIKKNKSNTDFVVRRVSQNFPQVERTRDSFDGTNVFIMEFKTGRGDNNVQMTIKFAEAFEHTC